MSAESSEDAARRLAAEDIANGLTDLLTWAHEPGGDLRDQHVQQGRELLAKGSRRRCASYGRSRWISQVPAAIRSLLESL